MSLIDQSDCCLVASDLHAGSVFALLRPGFKTQEGNEIGLNPFQVWLWQQFESCLEEVDRLADGRKFITVFNGDLLEGNHHRTKEIVMVNPVEHARHAAYLIEPILERSAYHAIVEGTECHTEAYEEMIGGQTKALKDPQTGRPIFKELNLEIHGCYGLFRHHMPTTSRMYLEASQLSIELGNCQLSYARMGLRVPKFVCAAHRHRPAKYSDGHGLFVVTPPWQGLTRYARKVVPDGKITPGFAWLDWRGKQPGELPECTLIVRSPLPNPIVIL